MNNTLPNFSLEKVPTIKLKEIDFKNFKAFDDCTFSFEDEEGVKDFLCFIGPNGTGKSTILGAIQLLFTRFEGRTKESISRHLGKAVRHVDDKQMGLYGEADFLITANFQTSIGDYEVQINKSGFIEDHPEKIKLIVYRLCFLARFDQELSMFQLERTKWPMFKELFESVTGFTIDECISPFGAFSSDPEQDRLLRKYVLDFKIQKPYEVIHHSECSDGERKIIKSFSTLLNMEITPQIVLIDNVEMHVELGRHAALVDSLKKCYPNSQIFTTSHSYYLSRLFGERSGIIDLRLLRADDIIKNEPWRLCLVDELKETILKITSLDLGEDLIERGENLLDACHKEINDLHIFQDEVTKFLKEVQDKIVIDIIPLLTE
tara:strand:+ start:2293 stop:3420 length:1128 start_codon:yes stop_codon:yes gene_type:complete